MCGMATPLEHVSLIMACKLKSRVTIKDYEFIRVMSLVAPNFAPTACYHIRGDSPKVPSPKKSRGQLWLERGYVQMKAQSAIHQTRGVFVKMKDVDL